MARQQPDLQRIIARSIGAKIPGRAKPKHMVEPAGALVTVNVTPNMLDAVDTWRGKRGLSRPEALLALAECGMRVFDHATRKR